jgi:phage terminase small subunit
MQRGRKAVSPELKKARGTFQPCRDRDEVAVSERMRHPVMPDYLTLEAQAVWAEEYERAVTAHVTELDSSLFARYCALEAVVRALLKKSELPTGNLLTELRRMQECLGLAGPSSRVGKVVAKPASPFADLLAKGSGTKQ